LPGSAGTPTLKRRRSAFSTSVRRCGTYSTCHGI
jgi:hypothetical protein